MTNSEDRTDDGAGTSARAVAPSAEIEAPESASSGLDELFESQEPRPHEQERTTRRDPLPVRVLDAPVAEARDILTSVHVAADRAEMKASFLLAAFAAGAAIGAALIPPLSDWADAANHHGRWVVVALAILASVLLSIAAIHAASSVYPRLGPEYQPPAGQLGWGDLIYFGRLRKLPAERIAAEIRGAIAEGRLVEHYAEQIHVNSTTTWKKHVRIRQSLLWFAAAVLCGFAALAVWVVLQAIS